MRRYPANSPRVSPPCLALLSGLILAPWAAALSPAPPTISMAFDVAGIAVGDTTNLVFTLQNPNAIALNGVDFSYPLPAGLTIPVPRGVIVACSVCAFTGSASFGGGSLFHSLNSVLSANANCTLTIHVTGIAAGVQSGATGNISSTEGGTGGTASASVNVEG